MARPSRASVSSPRPRYQAPRREGAASGDGHATPSRPIKLDLLVDLSVGRLVDRRVIDLLEAIETEGSLTQAAKKLGVSYRWSWMTLKSINEAFAQEAAGTPNKGLGGQAVYLTDFGRELVAQFRTLEVATREAGADTLRWLERSQAIRKSGSRRNANDF